MSFGGISLLDILPFIAIGFAAQLVDGALGMAFGVISNTLLLSLVCRPRRLRQAFTPWRPLPQACPAQATSSTGT